VRKPGINGGEFLAAWGKILIGRAPMLSIEITRECPLNCPGCYAYSDSHLGGGTTLRQLSDFRGDSLVKGVLELVRKHRPLHLSLVGGEPMIRHRELSRILPVLGDLGIHTLLVTSGIIPIPKNWMSIPRLRIAISVDGLPEDHDVRRQPATYERILQNIRECMVNVHWVITRPMLKRPSYLEEYVSFWSSRREVNHIWVSLYSPQRGEQSLEILAPEERKDLAKRLLELRPRYPKFLITNGIASAFVEPPTNPQDCLFARMSTNYSADLKTRVEPCVLGGAPDCSQCGCAASIGLHSVKNSGVVGPVKIDQIIRASMAVGKWIGNLRKRRSTPQRWRSQTESAQHETRARVAGAFNS
jgi:MoaA/NifB/PqqE/SkfB family radical SAM enzyme